MSLRRLAVVMIMCLGGCTWPQLFTPVPPPTLDEQLDELVRTIDEHPIPLHNDYTPSVYKLIELGDPAIPRMLDLMLAGNESARSYARRVLADITLTQFGEGPERDDRFRAFWASLGDLDSNAPLEERKRAVNLWRQWLAKNKG